MYSSERGTLSFDQLPWFTVAERLEAEKELMLEERERFTQMLNEQQVCACGQVRRVGRRGEEEVMLASRARGRGRALHAEAQRAANVRRLGTACFGDACCEVAEGRWCAAWGQVGMPLTTMPVVRPRLQAVIERIEQQMSSYQRAMQVSVAH